MGCIMNMPNSFRGQGRKRFCLVLVKPSHYDEEGYVIQWLRSPIPSNSLASLYGLATDCAERRVLGEDVDIDIHAFDETNTRIRSERIARLIETAGAGMVMLTGVQSNQFPRALDIARPLHRRGIAVRWRRDEFRRGTRLSLSVLVLYHHQRPG